MGTNKKGVNSAYGDVNLTYMHPGCLYIHSVHAKIGLGERDEQLEAHKQSAIDRRDANKVNQPPIRTRPIDSFFSTSKIPSQEYSTLTQEQVKEKLEEELFPETVEILLESEMKEDLNTMISSLQIGGTEVPYVSDDTYKKLRMRRYKEVANENRRKNKHYLSHATQEQKDTFSNEKKKCAAEGCDIYPRTGCNGHCLNHATQEQRDAFNDEKCCVSASLVLEAVCVDLRHSDMH